MGLAAESVNFGSSCLDPLALSPDAKPKRIGYWRNTKDTLGRRPYPHLLGPALLMDLTAWGLVHGRKTHYIWVPKMDPLHLGVDDGPITCGSRRGPTCRSANIKRGVDMDLAGVQIQWNLDSIATKSTGHVDLEALAPGVCIQVLTGDPKELDIDAGPISLGSWI